MKLARCAFELFTVGCVDISREQLESLRSAFSAGES